MIEAIRKAMLAGVGAAAITTEKAEKALNELVEKGRISASEAKETARKLADDGKREFEEATRMVESKFDESLSRLGRGHRERIEALEAQVSELSRRVMEMEADRVEAAAPTHAPKQ